MNDRLCFGLPGVAFDAAVHSAAIEHRSRSGGHAVESVKQLWKTTQAVPRSTHPKRCVCGCVRARHKCSPYL